MIGGRHCRSNAFAFSAAFSPFLRSSHQGDGRQAARFACLLAFVCLLLLFPKNLTPLRALRFSGTPLLGHTYYFMGANSPSSQKPYVCGCLGALWQKRRFACASNYFILRAKSLKKDESFCLISEKTRGRAALPKTKRKAPIVISTKRSAWRNLCNKYRPYCFLLPTPKKHCNDSIFQEISRLRAAPPFHSVRLLPRSARNDISRANNL